jgi:hypothetical protein
MKRLRKDYEEIAAMSKKESESADIIQVWPKEVYGCSSQVNIKTSF